MKPGRRFGNGHFRAGNIGTENPQNNPVALRRLLHYFSDSLLT